MRPRARIWRRLVGERGCRASTFIGRAERYGADLEAVLLSGLRELGLGRRDFRGRTVLLKPNLVEPHPGVGHINTHPRVVMAAVEAFRALGAERILVGEGSGHRRDGLLIFDQSGTLEAVRRSRARLLDLNHADLVAEPNRGGRSRLAELVIPRVVRDADWVVSLAKLKTHHWVGATLSMKNLFGVMPGVVYGWPKNLLHQVGIVRSILDINATLRPNLAIVDGIVGMEGDGPVSGEPKRAGVLVLGANLPAVDATCARVMGINPWRISYLARASGWLGPIDAARIEQRGESIQAVQVPFRLEEHVEAHRGLRLAPEAA